MVQAGLVLLGVVAGVLGGLFGIGGGLIIVPALAVLFGMQQKSAQGTSLALFMFPVGFFGVMNYYKNGDVDFWKVLYIGLGFIGGAFLGSKIAIGLDPKIATKSFAVFLVAVGVYMFFRK